MISLVVPMRNEEESLEMFFTRVVPIVESLTREWEIVCVNDGSRDRTMPLLRAWHQHEPRIKALNLSRNFGKEAALTAGLHHAQGQAVIPMDADLQDPPELIGELVARWQEGYQVVLATRRTRDGDSWLKKVTASLFYRLMGRITSVQMPADTGDFRLLDRQVVEVLKRLPERTRFMKGLFAWVGFPTTQVFFDRPPRAKGAPKQSYRRLWSLAKDGIFSFTTLPLRLSTYLGVLISVISFSYAGWLILRVMLFGVDVPGYASIMAAVLCMGGIQLISLGIIGEYLGRIYREVKQRPLYIVQEQLGL